MLEQERKMLFGPVRGACVIECGWGWHPACLDTHTENWKCVMGLLKAPESFSVPFWLTLKTCFLDFLGR